MRVDTFINKKFPKEKPQQGDTVAVFMGRGSMGGVILEPSIRKSRVRFVDGKEDWVENKKIRIINDEKWVHEILREMNKQHEGEE